MRHWADAARRAGLPALALIVAAVSIGGLFLAARASGTLGYDYATSYDPAARRFLAGQAIYDLHFSVAGPAGLFAYPAIFLIPLVPFAALLPHDAATITWTLAMVAAFLGGIALLPVRPTVRWATLLLGSLAWPVVYSLKLGQVGALLFLLFVAGWRLLRDDQAVGVVATLGTAIKFQPALLFGWAIVLLLPNVHAMSERMRGWTLTAGFALSVQALFFAPQVAPFLYFQF